MFRIGIAEDDPSFQKTISEYIERYKKETNIDIQASFFQDGNELVFKYEPIYDVLLLDIEMPKMNGMDAAREIRKRIKSADYIYNQHGAICNQWLRSGCLGLCPEAYKIFFFFYETGKSPEVCERPGVC